MADFIKPEYFRDIVLATKKVAVFDESNLTFKIPSLAKKIGNGLSFCAIPTTPKS